MSLFERVVLALAILVIIGVVVFGVHSPHHQPLAGAAVYEED